MAPRLWSAATRNATAVLSPIQTVQIVSTPSHQRCIHLLESHWNWVLIKVYTNDIHM